MARIYVREHRNIRFSVKIAQFSRIKWWLNENKWKEKIFVRFIFQGKHSKMSSVTVEMKNMKRPLNDTHLENPQYDELVREDLQLIDHHLQAATALSGISRASELNFKIRILI